MKTKSQLSLCKSYGCRNKIAAKELCLKHYTREQVKKIGTSTERVKKWKENHRERDWVHRTIKMHEYKNQIINIEPKRLAQMRKDTTHCCLCNKRLRFNNKWSDDLGSLDRLYNDDVCEDYDILIICVSCNSQKGSKTIIEYLETLESEPSQIDSKPETESCGGAYR